MMYRIRPIWAWTPDTILCENEVNIMTRGQFRCWCDFPWKGTGVRNFTGVQWEDYL